MDLAESSVRLANGLSLPFFESGEPLGTALVLLHAWGESKGSFERLLPALPRRVHAFAMDQRGHGTADKPSTGFGLSDYASDVVEFMDAVGIKSAVILGASSGGYVAQQVAIEAPERAAALVLVGSPRTLHGRPGFADEIDKLVDPIDPEWVRASLEWFPRFQPVPAWFLDNRVVDGTSVPARVWRQALEGLTAAPAPTDIGKITAPTLIIWGARDEILRFEDQEALSEAIPDSQLVVYQDTGHLVLWEQPDRIAADVVAWIEQFGLKDRPNPSPFRQPPSA